MIPAARLFVFIWYYSPNLHHEKVASTAKTLLLLPAAIRLEEKMGEELGAGALLFQGLCQ